MRTAQRPQLTLTILFYAIFDAIGMAIFATGILWLTQGKSLFISDFPSNRIEALAATLGGLLLMVWAASRIVRELIQRPAKRPREGN